MFQDLECKISVNLLLEAAHRLFSYDKIPLALTLIYIVLEQYPEHPNARKFYEMFTGKSMPANPISKSHRLYHDSETDMFIVTDKVSGTGNSFRTFDEVKEYLRGLK